MNFKELKELIEICSRTDGIEELEVERAGVRLRIRTTPGRRLENAETAVVPPAPARNLAPSSPAEPPPVDLTDVSFVTSPMVGTFYRAPGPDAEPFVKIGDFVEKGTVVCIIEAMKLMNEIESDLAGEVVSIPVENGQPVEFGERLLAIRPR